MPQTMTSVGTSVASQGPTRSMRAGSKASGARVMAPAVAAAASRVAPSAAVPQARRLELPQSTAIQSAVKTVSGVKGGLRGGARGVGGRE